MCAERTNPEEEEAESGGNPAPDLELPTEKKDDGGESLLPAGPGLIEDPEGEGESLLPGGDDKGESLLPGDDKEEEGEGEGESLLPPGE